MNDSTNEEAKLLDIQIITTIIFIGAIIVSIVLSYDEKMRLLYKKGLFNRNTSNKVEVYNRILITIIFIIYLYINIKDTEIAAKNNKDTRLFKLEVVASAITVIAALIVLYVVIVNSNVESQSEVENPEV